MRRKDREICKTEEILQIIDRCQVCRLGFADGDSVYMVPLSFGYSWKTGQLTLYFHGASAGRKMELARQKKWCGFEMDLCAGIAAGKRGCDYSALYRSVIGEGRIEEVEDPGEKELCLRHIMAHYTDRTDLQFAPGALEQTAVLKLEAEWVSAKGNG